VSTIESQPWSGREMKFIKPQRIWLADAGLDVMPYKGKYASD
jgi:hypothetical protein